MIIHSILYNFQNTNPHLILSYQDKCSPGTQGPADMTGEASLGDQEKKSIIIPPPYTRQSQPGDSSVIRNPQTLHLPIPIQGKIHTRARNHADL